MNEAEELGTGMVLLPPVLRWPGSSVHVSALGRYPPFPVVISGAGVKNKSGAGIVLVVTPITITRLMRNGQGKLPQVTRFLLSSKDGLHHTNAFFLPTLLSDLSCVKNEKAGHL